MAIFHASASDRVKGAGAALAMLGGLGYLLVLGLAVPMPIAVERGLKLFQVLPDPPPPVEKTAPHPVASHRREGAAAPPNLRAKASAVVAPVPIVPPPVPSPVIAAPQPGIGRDPAAGAADRPGPGSGASGIGTGTGSGGEGDGDGDGGDESPPRQVRGRIRNSDYPEAAKAVLAGGRVSVRYTVETDGRVGDCIVTRSSGNAALDEATCRLIRKRFRFRPSRDADGVAVPSIIVENHDWVVDDRADPPPPER